MRSWFVFLGLFISLLLVASTAGAEFPSANLRRFQPPIDPAGSLYLEPTPTSEPGVWSGAAWFVYSYRPQVLRDANGAAVATLVRHHASADLVTSIGVVPNIALALDLPVLLFQQGEDNQRARALVGGPPPAQALGDLGLAVKGNILSYGQLGGFGLSSLLRLTAATGNTASYMGEGVSTGELRMLAEYKLVAVALQATAGIKLRAEERDVLRRSYGNEVPWGFAVSVKPQVFGWDDKGRFTWVAEVMGATTLEPSAAARGRGQSRPASVALAGISARLAVRDFSFLLGVQTALTEGFGATPLQVVSSVQWTPRRHDADKDGVKDEADQCPELAEDRDGVQDADGCPDWDDADGDGVADKDDRCPEDKEDQDGYDDEDGCPDPDNDQDGIIDIHDACPTRKGELRDNPETSGCPDFDRDGFIDKVDKCPNEAEDVDGVEDADGCPDTDNDKDGVVDSEDRCPNTVPGPYPHRGRPGCPATDRDGDTWEDASDKCPDEAETFNGVEDQDGCSDKGGRALVVVDEKGSDLTARFARPVRFKGSREAPEVEPASIPVLRALALELNRHDNWMVAVGVRARSDGPMDQQAALAQAFAAVELLRTFAFREDAAETVGWKAVSSQPGAGANGFGVLVLARPEQPAEPEKAEPEKAEPDPKPGDTPTPGDAPKP